MRMLSEWLVKTYPKDYYVTRVRLGRVPAVLITADMPEEEARMLGVWRRWADALVIKPDRLILIEAAIRPDPGDISKLQLYASLLPCTTEYEEHKDKPIELLLLYSLEDPVIVALAREQGIRTVYYKPAWLSDYLAILYPRERRAPLS